MPLLRQMKSRRDRQALAQGSQVGQVGKIVDYTVSTVEINRVSTNYWYGALELPLFFLG